MSRSISLFIIPLLIVMSSAHAWGAATLLKRYNTDDSPFSGEFHPNDPKLYLTRTARSIKLINIETGSEVWSAAGDGYGTRVLPVLFDSTGDRIFAADLRGAFRVLSGQTGEVLATFNLPETSAFNFATVLALGANGDRLYAADREVVYEFSLSDYKLLRRFVTPRSANEIMGMFVSANEIKTLDNNRLTTWSLSDPAPEPQPSSYVRLNASIVIGHADRTAASADGSLIFLNEENSLTLIDLDGQKVRACTGFTSFPWSSRPLGVRHIVSVHSESVLKVWDAATCLVVDEIALTDSQLNGIFPFAVRVAADSTTVAVSSRTEIIFYSLTR